MNTPDLDRLSAQLREATTRGSMPMDIETQELQATYRSLGKLLDQSAATIDVAALVANVLADEPQATPRAGGQYHWLPLLAMAASIVAIAALAAYRLGEVPNGLLAERNAARNVNPIAANEVNSTDVEAASSGATDAESGSSATTEQSPVVDEQLAWDDDWDDQAENAAQLADQFRVPRLTRLTALNWSVQQAVEEVEAELGSM
jgi:hypothetical protein